MTRLFLGLPAPAKLNLFLHVIGRRSDGFHELQSVFVPVSLTDTLDFESRDYGRIERSGDINWPKEADLAVRAARLLQSRAGIQAGVNIHAVKNIPDGSGMGGGSSDAATTLIALNRLWNLHWPRERLAGLASELGADVPFFLGPGPAFVEGVGERLTPVVVKSTWYAVVYPGIAVSTARIFAEVELTPWTKPTTISDFSAATSPLDEGELAQKLPRESNFWRNDLEAIARRQHSQIDAAISCLQRWGPARMTGSGSAVFAPMFSQADAQRAVFGLPFGWSGFAVKGLEQHPLADW